MGMIKSRSIIPHSPTDDSPRTTPHHSCVTGIDIIDAFRLLEIGFFTPVCGLWRSLIVYHIKPGFTDRHGSKTNIVKFISGGGSTKKIAYV